MPNTHDKLIGEIVQDRYAVLERTGPDRYKVFDMKELCQLELLRWDSEWLPLPRIAAAPVPRPAAPPPIPPAARREVKPAAPQRRGRTTTGRFEAAWFARGELVEQGEAEAEVTDYLAYQAHLEQLAVEIEGRPHPLAVGSSLKSKEQHPVLLLAIPELA